LQIGKLAASGVEPLLGQCDLFVGLRRMMRDREEVRDLQQRATAGVEAQLAPGLPRHIADRDQQCGAIEHRLCCQHPVVPGVRGAKENQPREAGV
jgi:hypothetical protein